jgi:hypothetical protein
MINQKFMKLYTLQDPNMKKAVCGGIAILKSNQRLFFTQKIVSPFPPSKILFDEIFLVKKGNNSFKNCPIKLPS